MAPACDAGSSHGECGAVDCNRGEARGCYRYGLLRSQTNEAGAPQEGLRYLERGCALGSADACHQIGEIETAEIGLAGVPRSTWPPTDPEDALRHYERGCALGDDRSCRAPAAHFGDAPEQTRMMCASHERTCAHGVPQIQQPPSGASCRIAAWCHETGRSGAKDAARACALNRSGCALENPGACAAAKKCLTGATPVARMGRSLSDRRV